MVMMVERPKKQQALNMKVDADLLGRLERIATQHNYNISELSRRLLMAGLTRLESQLQHVSDGATVVLL